MVLGKTMSSRLIAVGCFLVLLSACSRVGNYERAYFAKQGTSYLVELKGTRRLMAHDPISAIRGRTYEETLTLQLPRLEGVIKGPEIPVTADKLRYTGQLVITNDKMKLDLYYDNPGDSIPRPLPWNGEYTLVPR